MQLSSVYVHVPCDLCFSHLTSHNMSCEISRDQYKNENETFEVCSIINI